MKVVLPEPVAESAGQRERGAGRRTGHANADDSHGRLGGHSGHIEMVVGGQVDEAGEDVAGSRRRTMARRGKRQQPWVPPDAYKPRARTTCDSHGAVLVAGLFKERRLGIKYVALQECRPGVEVAGVEVSKDVRDLGSEISAARDSDGLTPPHHSSKILVALKLTITKIQTYPGPLN